MNEGNGPGLPGSKPAAGLRNGEYWRLISHDVIDFLDYVYPNGLDFQEVAADQSADIVIGVFAW